MFTFDDPAVADELVIGYATLQHPAEDDGLVRDSALPVSFVRLLTPDLDFGIDNTGIVRNRGNRAQQAGFNNIDVTLKAMLFRSDPHEILLSTAIRWEIGGTGDAGVGEDKPNFLQPGIYYGKGFGDLPNSLAWFPPAIPGAVTAELPTRGSTTIVGVNRSNTARST